MISLTFLYLWVSVTFPSRKTYILHMSDGHQFRNFWIRRMSAGLIIQHTDRACRSSIVSRGKQFHSLLHQCDYLQKSNCDTSNTMKLKILFQQPINVFINIHFLSVQFFPTIYMYNVFTFPEKFYLTMKMCKV